LPFGDHPSSAVTTPSTNKIGLLSWSCRSGASSEAEKNATLNKIGPAFLMNAFAADTSTGKRWMVECFKIKINRCGQLPGV